MQAGGWAGRSPRLATLVVLTLFTLAAVSRPAVDLGHPADRCTWSASPAFAVAATSVLFAAVHVATYDFSILPLDLAAGARITEPGTLLVEIPELGTPLFVCTDAKAWSKLAAHPIRPGS